MAWISITEDHVLTKVSGPELAAMKAAALGQGQTGPQVLADVISQVVDEIRGYVAAHQANTLGAGETIPQKLLSAALSIIRYRFATRLPVKSLVTQDRKDENDAAVRLLEKVSAGSFAVEEPLTADTEVQNSPRPRITIRTRFFSNQDGI